MKKLIVIASAVIAMLFAVALITYHIELLTYIKSYGAYLPSIHDYSSAIIVPLVVILISVIVIFNIKLPKTLRIILSAFAIAFIIALGTLLFHKRNDVEKFIFIIGFIGFIPATITLLTFIRRALKPTDVKENK